MRPFCKTQLSIVLISIACLFTWYAGGVTNGENQSPAPRGGDVVQGQEPVLRAVLNPRNHADLMTLLSQLQPLQKPHYCFGINVQPVDPGDPQYMEKLIQYVRLTRAASIRFHYPFTQSTVDGVVLACQAVNEADADPVYSPDSTQFPCRLNEVGKAGEVPMGNRCTLPAPNPVWPAVQGLYPRARDHAVRELDPRPIHPPASLGLVYAPWHDWSGSLPTDPDQGYVENVYLPRLTAVLQAIDNANLAYHVQSPIRVSAALLDCERWLYDVTPPIDQTWNDALRQKLDAVYLATVSELARFGHEGARIEWYNRGAVGRAASGNGWSNANDHSGQELGDSGSCSLYDLPQLGFMRETYRRTVERVHGPEFGCPQCPITPWVALNFGQEPIACGTTYKFGYNYPLAFSWQIGAELNHPMFVDSDHRDRYPSYDQCRVVAFYPSIFDPRSENVWAHFAAYVRGANLQCQLDDILYTPDVTVNPADYGAPLSRCNGQCQFCSAMDCAYYDCTDPDFPDPNDPAPNVDQMLEYLAPPRKVHYCYGINGLGVNLNPDDAELMRRLLNYVRLTRAATLQFENYAFDDVRAAVATCLRINAPGFPNPTNARPATIGLRYRPYYDWLQNPGNPDNHYPPTADHAAYLAAFDQRLRQVRDDIDLAWQQYHVEGDLPVTVSCVILDHRVWPFREPLDPANPNDPDVQWNQAVLAKLTDIRDHVLAVWPGVRLEWRGRGQMERSESGDGWTEGRFCPLSVPGSAAACDLPGVWDQFYMDETYRRTLTHVDPTRLADPNSGDIVTPWVSLGAGPVRGPCNELGTFANGHDYLMNWSFGAGSEIDHPWYGQIAQQDRFAPWRWAKVVIINPSIFDSNDADRNWLHFIAYIRGSRQVGELRDLDR